MARLVRFVVGAVAIAAFATVALVLQLSDRIGQNFGELSYRLGVGVDHLEQVTGVEVLRGRDIPFEVDTIGHALLWGVGMLIVGTVARRTIPLLVITVGMIGLGLGFELAQQRFTFSRSAELTDAVANAVGIVGAAVLVAAVGWLADRRQAAVSR